MLKDISGLKIWIRRICLSSILILIIEGLFELFQPLIWTFLLSSNVEKRTVGRIAGALIDSNVFACTLIILFLSWLYTSDNRSRGINGAVFLIFGLSILYLVDLSGSRQGLIIILALPFYYYFKNISRSKLIKFGLVLMVCLSFIAIFQEQLTKFSTENPSSSIARMFGNSNDSQNKSNDERLTSILQGITMLQKDFFVLGPGIFNFNSRWASESDTTEPHNAVIYLLVQYGVFSLPLFYLFALSFYRAYKSSINGMVFVYFALFIHLMFQPNSMYYPISFFVVFIVDLGRSDFFNVRPKLVQG